MRACRSWPNGVRFVARGRTHVVVSGARLALGSRACSVRRRLVVRPDSGDPPVIVPQLLELLGKAFAEDVTTTATGHKVLPPYIRMIQGDGISYESLGEILKAMALAGWAAENLAFGSGGALLQKLNRDTQKCARRRTPHPRRCDRPLRVPPSLPRPT
jgi:hypothetical protein